VIVLPVVQGVLVGGAGGEVMVELHGVVLGGGGGGRVDVELHGVDSGGEGGTSLLLDSMGVV